MNALAVAPKAEFVLVKDAPTAQAALDAAPAESPKVISCSWGWPYEQSFPTVEATPATVGSQAREANGKSPLVGTCTRPVRDR